MTTAPLAAPDWDALRASWPNAGASRFLDAAGVRWHVQVAGTGPVVLLLHGTGGATHSWRDLLPALARSCTVVAPDLPGHGFTRALEAGASLDGMARAVRALCDALGVAPVVAAGHSAGVAVLLAMARDRMLGARAVVGFGAALVPPPAWYRSLLAPLVNPVALSGSAARALAAAARTRGIADLMLEGTGSAIPESQRALYRALFAAPAHVRGALAMMAHWDLASLLRSLRGAALPPVTLHHGTRDAFVPLARLRAAVAGLPGVTVVPWEGAGHLLHEERPEAAADAVRAAI